MKAIHASAAGEPHGHYVHALVHGDTIYVSGLLGNSRDEHRGAVRPIEEQAAHCLDQLAAILAEAGSSLSLVLKLGIFVASVDEWPKVNALCAERFGAHRPARIVVPCGPMRYGSLIEIDAIAATGE